MRAGKYFPRSFGHRLHHAGHAHSNHAFIYSPVCLNTCAIHSCSHPPTHAIIGLVASTTCRNERLHVLRHRSSTPARTRTHTHTHTHTHTQALTSAHTLTSKYTTAVVIFGQLEDIREQPSDAPVPVIVNTTTTSNGNGCAPSTSHGAV